MRKFWIIITAIVIIAAVSAVLYFRREADGRYNLLFITMDTTRADRLGCYGYSGAVTTALDALADSGVKFNRAFCNVPLTLPSHATMMTGLYPPEHGCRVNGAHELAGELTTLAEIFASHGYQTAAFVAAFVLDSKFGLNRGFQTYDDFEVPTADDIYDENIMYRYRRADKVADAALSWLRTHSRRPFFCWVHFFDPHRPYYVNRPLAATDKGKAYDGEIAFMDSQIARLIDYLRQNNLIGKTIIVAVGDHGEGLGEHGEDEHGLLLYNTSMRVPLLISSPGLFPRGKEVATLVSTVDLFPTILDIFGWNPTGHVSGRNLAAALSGETIPQRPFYAETEFPLTEYGWSPLISVTESDWKYIKAPREELYDIKSDPGELKNLAAAEPKKLSELKARLAAIEEEMVKKESSEVSLDEASQKVLESLGYLGGGRASAGREKETASLRDPKDAVWMRVEFIKAIEDFKNGKNKKAESSLRKLIKESPESYTFRYKLAKTLYDQGKFKEARIEFEEMVTMAPEEYKSHYNLGKTLMKLGEYDRAIGEFRMALTFDPEQTAGYNNLGIALLKTGDVGEAMEAFRKSLSMNDDQIDPHNNLGNALLSLGRVDDALVEFRRAVEVNPDFFEGRFNIGLILLNRGRHKEAAEQFRHAARLRPDFAPAHRNLGVALTRSGQVTEGLKAFSRAEYLAQKVRGK